MATPVSYAKAITPLFRQIDIDHMKPFDVKLDDYGWMSDPAGGVLGSCNDYPDHAPAKPTHRLRHAPKRCGNSVY
jgi:hypothetical protein